MRTNYRTKEKSAGKSDQCDDAVATAAAAATQTSVCSNIVNAEALSHSHTLWFIPLTPFPSNRVPLQYNMVGARYYRMSLRSILFANVLSPVAVCMLFSRCRTVHSLCTRTSNPRLGEGFDFLFHAIFHAQFSVIISELETQWEKVIEKNWFAEENVAKRAYRQLEQMEGKKVCGGDERARARAKPSHMQKKPTT